MVKDPHAQAEKVYEQMIDLLEELSTIYSDAAGEEDEDEGEFAAADRDIVEGLIEEAVERGLDEESVERVFKSIAAFAKKAREG